jgi:DNA polymerase
VLSAALPPPMRRSGAPGGSAVARPARARARCPSRACCTGAAARAAPRQRPHAFSRRPGAGQAPPPQHLSASPAPAAPNERQPRRRSSPAGAARPGLASAPCVLVCPHAPPACAWRARRLADPAGAAANPPPLPPARRLRPTAPRRRCRAMPPSCWTICCAPWTAGKAACLQRRPAPRAPRPMPSAMPRRCNRPGGTAARAAPGLRAGAGPGHGAPCWAAMSAGPAARRAHHIAGVPTVVTYDPNYLLRARRPRPVPGPTCAGPRFCDRPPQAPLPTSQYAARACCSAT